MDFVFYLLLIVSPQFCTLLQSSVFKIVDMYTSNPVLKSTLLAQSSCPLCSFTSSLGHGFAKGPTSTVEPKPVSLVPSDNSVQSPIPRRLVFFRQLRVISERISDPRSDFKPPLALRYAKRNTGILSISLCITPADISSHSFSTLFQTSSMPLGGSG
jgi:hypothetical protein